MAEDYAATSAPPEVLMGRQGCREPGCFASFEPSAAHTDEVRHCNRGGPDGGHPHQWNGTTWEVTTGAMQHDRS